ncbi:hypothetical protein [Spirosoma telluris]|uniref:hypothetical protein n=1 Tax=Spirosoma telluris TaxID=2183553 RepID=UPI002FC2C087
MNTTPTTPDQLAANSLIRIQSYVNGEWVNAISGETFDVIDPATGDVIASVPDMGRPMCVPPLMWPMRPGQPIGI